MAGWLGGLTVTILLVTVIPAMVAGLFAYRRPINSTWMTLGWALAVLIAFFSVYGGSPLIFSIISLALLGLLTLLRKHKEVKP